MKKYTGTKTVQAFKIGAQELYGFGGGGALYPTDSSMPPRIVSESYLLKHTPAPGGYYVRYEDGYESYSPAEAFEKAYRESPIHPASQEFTDEQLKTDEILRFFHYNHLSPQLAEVSKPFCELAKTLILVCPRTPERTVALRKLLEAKDAAVRTKVK
jgi:hypothetical protein